MTLERPLTGDRAHGRAVPDRAVTHTITLGGRSRVGSRGWRNARWPRLSSLRCSRAGTAASALQSMMASIAARQSSVEFVCMFDGSGWRHRTTGWLCAHFVISLGLQTRSYTSRSDCGMVRVTRT